MRAHHDWDLLADRLAAVLDEIVAKTSGTGKMTKSGAALKRGLDVSASAVALALLALPLATIALAIKLDDRGPVFFCQERVRAFIK